MSATAAIAQSDRQPPPPADAVTLDQIVVSNPISKFSVALFETPQAITVIVDEQIERQGAVSVEEALRFTPSVQAELAGRQGFDDFLVRGFSQSRYQFRDGLRLDPGFLQQQEPWGMESIEVLKGPASVLYGQIAPGGLVNMSSKFANATALRELGLQVGSFGLVRGYADIGGPLDANAHWSARLPVLVSTRDDVQDFVGAKRQFLAPSITWAPSDNTELNLFALYQHDAYDRTIGLPLEGTLRPNPNGRLPRSRYLGEPGLPQLESTQWQLGYLLRHRLTPALDFRSKLRYSDFQLDGPIVQAPRPGSTATSVTRRGFFYDADRTLLSLDNQVEAVFDVGNIEHRFVAGVDYQRYAIEDAGDLFGLAPINPFDPVYGAAPDPLGPFFASDNRLTQLGVYAQYRAKIDERFVAVAGARFSESENLTGAPGAPRNLQDDDEVTVNAALMYLAPNGFAPYYSYSQSFEPQVGFDPLTSGQTPPPSLGRQHEVGLRWRSSERRLEATASLFRIDQTNIVNPDLANPGFSVLVGEQRHDGFELELTGRPWPSLQLQGGYAYLDAEITGSNAGDEGLRPINVPRHAAAMFATLDGTAFGASRMDVSAGFRYVGERRANDIGETLPDYTVVDIGARYRFERFTLGLNLKNLFDERYFTAGGVRSAIDGEPRVVQATLRASF
ncbi:MAG: TonB-dependent siderophore receptor [Aquimonas sp.]|nr:TonB-dependent siderophore receptor [Aquimonas sp.]